MPDCKQCGLTLVGRQRSFCSATCGNRYWTLARQLGTAVPGFTDPDPVVNAFLQEFKELLLKHLDAIGTLATKRKF